VCDGAAAHEIRLHARGDGAHQKLNLVQAQLAAKLKQGPIAGGGVGEIPVEAYSGRAAALDDPMGPQEMGFRRIIAGSLRGTDGEGPK
jgi:hypothetical protein